MKKKEINKPLTVALIDSKNAMIEVINKIANENKLSYFLLELVVNEIHNEIIKLKNEEIERERKEFNERSEKNE